MKKYIFCFLFVSFSWVAMAQKVSVSPYSAYGVGDILFNNSPEQSGMANISAVKTSSLGVSANFSNPATNGRLPLTSFEVSANTNFVKFKDKYNSSDDGSTHVSNISLAFPVSSKASFGFGFQPYSSVGYKFTSQAVNEEDISFKNSFDGDGGLNSLHAMGSYQITKELSLGLRVNYLFGEMNNNQTIITDGLDLRTKYNFKNEAKGFQFTAGAYYSKQLKDNKHFDVGATYTFGSKLNSDITNLATTFAELNMATINLDTIHMNTIDGKTKLPQAVSLGVSYGRDLRWMVALQGDWADWGGFSMTGQDTSYSDTYFRIAAGGYWIPNFNSFKSYFHRVVYRAGAFYEATPLELNGEGIKKYGLTLGFGLPIGKSGDASMLNIGVELGKRGKADYQTIEENYANIKIGFTLNDVWFRKRVID